MEAPKRARQADGGTIVKEVEETLDAELWCKLQVHIPLQILWEKLPYEDLLRLRVVCKAWNYNALRRLEPKPYFVTITMGFAKMHNLSYLNGLVNYDVVSKEFSFRRQPFPLHHPYFSAHFILPPFAVEGLIFCYHPDDLDQQGVYNVHTKAWHAVPQAPETSSPDSFEVCGMMVDTSERPYSFKLILGKIGKETQIYDSRSRSWSTTSSLLLQFAPDPLNEFRSYSCMCYNDRVYMSLGQQMIFVYSMEEDSWTTLDFPPVIVHSDHNTLGVWDGRIFTTREDCEEQMVSVWELVDPKKQEWVEYARCSEDEYHQLMLHDSDHDTYIYEEMQLVSFFCDEYLLVCNWQFKRNRADAFVVFNMKTKKWEPVGLPMGTVSIADKEDDEFEDEQMETDDEDDADEFDNVDEVDEVDDFDNYGDVDDVDDVKVED